MWQKKHLPFFLPLILWVIIGLILPLVWGLARMSFFNHMHFRNRRIFVLILHAKFLFNTKIVRKIIKSNFFLFMFKASLKSLQEKGSLSIIELTTIVSSICILCLWKVIQNPFYLSKLFHNRSTINHLKIIKFRDKKFLTNCVLLHIFQLQSVPKFFCNRDTMVDFK